MKQIEERALERQRQEELRDQVHTPKNPHTLKLGSPETLTPLTRQIPLQPSNLKPGALNSYDHVHSYDPQTLNPGSPQILTTRYP
eukprot:1101749-Prorocentrum_minimum.AAC.2